MSTDTGAASPPRLGGGGSLGRNTTHTGVADALRAAILDGTLAPGSPLREAHIAIELGVSRGPVREAFGILADEGLVMKIPFRGAYVAEVSARQIIEITGLRQHLEPWAIELAMPQLAAGGRSKVVAALENMVRGADDGDLMRSHDAHMSFHRAFYELSGHVMLLDLWRSWEAQLQLFLSADERALEDLHDMVASHERLLRIIDGGDLEAITHEVQRHVHGPSLPASGDQ